MRGEPHVPERRLEHAPEEVQRVHVQQQVEEAAVEEARGQQPPPLAVGHERAVEHEVAVDGVVRARLLSEVHQHVDRDQHVGDRRVGVHVAHRPHLGALARALRAAHPDRRRGHAVGADRVAAVRAGDPGLAVLVAVADGHRAATLAVDPQGCFKRQESLATSSRSPVGIDEPPSGSSVTITWSTSSSDPGTDAVAVPSRLGLNSAAVGSGA